MYLWSRNGKRTVCCDDYLHCGGGRAVDSGLLSFLEYSELDQRLDIVQQGGESRTYKAQRPLQRQRLFGKNQTLMDFFKIYI